MTQFRKLNYFSSALKIRGAFDAEHKLVIASNHDIYLDGKFWAKNYVEYGDDPDPYEAAVYIVKGPLVKEVAATYQEEDTSPFTLKHGRDLTIYSPPYAPSYGDLAFPYERVEDRFNVLQHVREGTRSLATHRIPQDVEIVLIYGPSKGIMDRCPHGDLGKSLLMLYGECKTIGAPFRAHS